jgi:5-methylcytosine-specific restriction endonuclease McrA
MRSVQEWIGKTPDSAVPPRVRRRIFDAAGGKCHISGREIRPGERWELEHKIALCNGGEHRESNLAPALYQPHKEKTAQDVAVKSKISRIRNRHLGIKKRKGRPIMGSKASGWKRKFDGSVVRR